MLTPLLYGWNFLCVKRRNVLICGAGCIRRDTGARAMQAMDVTSAALEKLSVFGGNKGSMRLLDITRICKESEILFPISLNITLDSCQKLSLLCLSSKLSM